VKKPKNIWDNVAAEIQALAASVAEDHPLPAGFALRTARVAPPPAIDAAGVKEARNALRVSQTVFARFLGIKSQTVKDWERGVRVPMGAVRRLLFDIRNHPEHWAARLREEVLT